MRPLYLQYPDQPYAYANADAEYLYGPDLLVAPVTVFFTLSGFLITRNLLVERDRRGEVSLGRFWWNRFGPMFAAEIRRKRVEHMRAYTHRRCREKRMARFYALTIERSLFVEFLLVRRWGRIGRHGQTIDAIQLLAAAIAGKGETERKEVVVDAAGYRDRRGRCAAGWGGGAAADPSDADNVRGNVAGGAGCAAMGLLCDRQTSNASLCRERLPASGRRGIAIRPSFRKSRPARSRSKHPAPP